MQRTFVAIALALAMTCAFATLNPTNYVKPPVTIAVDTNFTNVAKTGFGLGSVTTGDLYLIALNLTTVGITNSSAYSWNVWMKKIATKDLSVSANSSLSFTDPIGINFYNNYVIAMNSDNDTGVPALRVYQLPVSGGAAIPRITVSTNTNATFTPASVGTAYIGKTGYIFYLAAEKKVNVTSFTIGGAVGTNEWTLTTTLDGNSVGLLWGEALSTSQVWGAWIEGGVYKTSIIDLSKGSASATAVGGWNSNYTCTAYVTDKKYYGVLCGLSDTTAKTMNYSITTANNTLTKFISTNLNQSFPAAYPYGPYLALFYTDSQTTAGTNAYSFDIWNLDTYAAFKNNTQFLTNTDTQNTTVQFGRVQAGGIYTLTYVKATDANNTVTYNTFQVGLVLGSSYLTTIFGFLCTIIAGLFLF